jgi:hypothetical protein|tara:strand:- start:123 stop:392 length:270 start_codon:yes stop_codon:yes gene_type:complete
MRPKRPSESSARPAEAKLWKESALKRIFGDRPFIADDRKSDRMEVAGVKRFKGLVNENGELRKMLADEMLKNLLLEESLKKLGIGSSKK